MRVIRRMAGPAAILMAAALAIAVEAQAPQGGGGAAPPPPPQNLQVLPKDMPRAELLATMRGFTTGLGVQCSYCHLQEGRGGRNDMASDEKATKKTARVMLRMVAHVNETLATELGAPAAGVTRVQCATCHRGESIPKTPPPPAAPGAAPPPAF